jgi:predicted GIY-YIG superfamily endonuclease
MIKRILMTLFEFADQFSAYIKNNGDSPKDWYVGVTSNPERRLFEDHKIKKDSDTYIYDNAGSEESARTIKEYLIKTLGTRGYVGDEDSKKIWVYAYKIGSTTDQ